MTHAGPPVEQEIERLNGLILRELRQGSVHQSTLLLSLGCLARLRHHRGEYREAELMYRRALELYRTLKIRRPSVLSGLLLGLASLLREMGRETEAHLIYEACHTGSAPQVQVEELAARWISLN